MLNNSFINNSYRNMIESQIQHSNPSTLTNLKPAKSEICRFYLRGLCMFKPSQCHFAHSVWDLHYTPYQEGEHIDYDYSKLDKDTKQTIIKGPRNYVNLYDYQKQKVFTLDELNEDSAKRKLIRNQMHQQMFEDFINLLICYYPDQLFTEHFLLREYTRVGFNKSMSVIKLNHISSMLCDSPSSRFYIIGVVLPPSVKTQTNILVTLCEEDEMINFYREAYEDYLNENKGDTQITQNQIKKYLFGIYRPSLSILPLNLVLKRRKMNFANFLKLISNKENQIVMEADQQTLLKASLKFIQGKVKDNQGHCSWRDVYKFLGQEFKVNNANITNALKPKLVDEGYLFLNFPMTQILSTEKVLHNWKWKLQKSENGNIKSVCECNMKQKYAQEELMLSFLKMQEYEIPPKQSLDIYNLQTLMRCAPHILNSKILGVDLEGRLRKNGFIEMIQINNGVNTFLIDIYRMLLEGQMETFELTKKIMRNIMCDEKILKIFHDCRHDTLVLHQIMNTCVVNIFDTSAVETFRGQLRVYESEKDRHKALKIVSNVKTPGLNEILQKYHAPHGINRNKDWFHQLWKKGHTDLFQIRPLDPQYREYCIKDVLDLPHVYSQMIQGLSPDFTNWISSHYVRAGYLYTINETQK